MTKSTATLKNRSFLDACLGKKPQWTPVWFMRQAGRYLPSYRQVKGNMPMLNIAKNPALSSQVVVDAVDALGVDAGILFADIMLPLEPMGIDFTIEENLGPVVNKPVRSIDDVNALKEVHPEAQLGFVYDGVDETLRKLDDGIPLIGFSGAPFTLAGYMIEGRPSRELERTKAMMYSQPETWKLLMEKLTKMVKVYLAAQVSHGVHAVQLFDSWVGCLSPADYRRYVSPYTKEIFSSLKGKVPRIHFCASSAHLLDEFLMTGPEVLSVDWRVDLTRAWATCRKAGLQGNLDPVLALAGGKAMERGVAAVLDRCKGKKGHVFSLGHGVLRETDPESLRTIVKTVHRATEAR